VSWEVFSFFGLLELYEKERNEDFGGLRRSLRCSGQWQDLKLPEMAILDLEVEDIFECGIGQMGFFAKAGLGTESKSARNHEVVVLRPL
jgi:hypothetical protein